ncbi:hypothetical protein C8Q80DRAFT_1175293 [Daedaleopsis nitida]|nr:hypothetical protein C8Q80DRAFT_1175293 [Daedaleopsis nitida]
MSRVTLFSDHIISSPVSCKMLPHHQLFYDFFASGKQLLLQSVYPVSQLIRTMNPLSFDYFAEKLTAECAPHVLSNIAMLSLSQPSSSEASSPCRGIDLYLESAQDLDIVQQFLLNPDCPQLECLVLDYQGPHPGCLVLPPLTSLRHLAVRGLVCSTSQTLHSLVAVWYEPRHTSPAHPHDLRTLLEACSSANDVRLKFSSFPTPCTQAKSVPPIPYPELSNLWVEDEWNHLRSVLAHIQAPPSAHVDIIAHSDSYDFDLGLKGFWLDILPPNSDVTLPMVSLSRAIRLSTNLYEPDDPDVRVPSMNGAVLAGGLNPSDLDQPSALCSWTVSVPGCREFSEELIPTTLTELSHIVDVSQLESLEMHTVPYVSPSRSYNEWDVFFRDMTSLERLEVGGIRAMELVLDTLTGADCALPTLRELVLCFGVLPSGEVLQEFCRLFSSACALLKEREQPLERLYIRIPEERVGLLADYAPLMKTVEARGEEFAQFAGVYFTGGVVRKYCKSCHDGASEAFEQHVEEAMEVDD